MPLDLEYIRRRNEDRKVLKDAATAGPWAEAETDNPWAFGKKPSVVTDDGAIRIAFAVADSRDRALIVSARNDPVEADVDALLAEVERLRAALEKGEWFVDQLECLAVKSHPSLYDHARAWREQVRKLLTLPSPS